ncbi:hypothetical protein [Streptomyces sp. NPDC016845]|uniref:hypothetical protein n=1 Tax=Streptomyces sp. NPDC016845 TaxID=3364972 RepID=UPI0037A61716
MADYFDRLLARGAPQPRTTGGTPDVVRVRPRLPGPFERIESLGSRAPFPSDDDTAEGLRPQAPAGPATPERHRPQDPTPVRSSSRPATETPVRARPPHTRGTPPSARALLVPPPLPPAAPVRPAGPEPARLRGPVASRRTDAGRELPRDRDEDRTTDSRPVVAKARPATTQARPAAPTVAGGGRTARRSAQESRGGPPPQRTVHVTIGRLEVRAAGRAPRDPGRDRETGHGPSSRPTPVMSLDTYLSRSDGTPNGRAGEGR